MEVLRKFIRKLFVAKSTKKSFGWSNTSAKRQIAEKFSAIFEQKIEQKYDMKKPLKPSV